MWKSNSASLQNNKLGSLGKIFCELYKSRNYLLYKSRNQELSESYCQVIQKQFHEVVVEKVDDELKCG